MPRRNRFTSGPSRSKSPQHGPDHLDVAMKPERPGGFVPRHGPICQGGSVLPAQPQEIRESNVGPDHPLVAMSLDNLAGVYRTMGQYAKAESLYQRSRKIFESQLGPDHPDIAKCLNNLAIPVLRHGSIRQGGTALPAQSEDSRVQRRPR